MRGVTIRSEGADRIVIELPGSASTVSGAASAGLAEETGDGDQALVLAGDEATVGKFPEDGGIVEVDGEKIRYGVRRGTILSELSRGLDGTQLALHPAGATVTLQATDPWRSRIENTGRMNFHIQAESPDLADPDPTLASDVEKERATMATWVQEHPGVPIAEYNRVLASREGPVKRLRWFPMRVTDEVELARPLEERVQALIIEENPDWQFEGGDLRTVYQSVDDLGLPAVGFEMKGPRQSDFGDFTEEHENKLMAIVINDEIVSMPNIEDKLPGSGIIRGQFTTREVQDPSRSCARSLKIAPTFGCRRPSEPRSATTTCAGERSALIGLAAVLLFAPYYQRLGMAGGQPRLQPGRADGCDGLHPGHADPARRRGDHPHGRHGGRRQHPDLRAHPRSRRGRKPLQSARDGFANAFSRSSTRT